MRAQIVGAGLAALVVAGLFTTALPISAVAANPADKNKVSHPLGSGAAPAPPAQAVAVGDLMLITAKDTLPAVEDGWTLRPTYLWLKGRAAEIKQDTKEIVPTSATALIAIIIKSKADIGEVDGSSFKLTDAFGASPNKPLIWSETRLSVELPREKSRVSPRDWRAEFVFDPSIYPAPFIAVCDGCDRGDLAELRAFLAKKYGQAGAPSATSTPAIPPPVILPSVTPPSVTPPSVTPPPLPSPAAAATRQLLVRIIDNDGNPVNRRWSISAFAGTCNQRRKATQSQAVQVPGDGVTIELPALNAAEKYYCFAFSPSDGSGYERKCLPLQSSFTQWTPYDWMIRNSQCPSLESNVSVVFRVKDGVTEKTETSDAVLSRVKSVTIRKKPLGYGVVTLDFDERVGPWKPEDAKMNDLYRDLYHVEQVKPDNESDARQLTVTLIPQFVELNKIQIAPQDSNGRSDQNCVLRLAVPPEAVFPSELWHKIENNRTAFDGGKIKINVESGRYVLPQPVLDAGFLIHWPPEQAGSPPVTISVAPDNRSADCNLPSDAKIERGFFLGVSFNPVVHVSKPGLEVIVSRLDRGNLDSVGLSPTTEQQFWSLFFNLVDRLDRSNSETGSRFEWAKIAQYQNAADPDRGVSIGEAVQSDIPLFGDRLSARTGKVNEAIEKLMTGDQAFVPIDVPVQLSGAIRQLSAGAGNQADSVGKNLVVVVGGPRLGDRSRTCVRLQNNDNALADAVSPKERNVKLVFLELLEVDKSGAAALPRGTAQTEIAGVSECDLSQSKWQGTAVSYVIDASQLLTGEPNRKTMADALAERIKKAFNIGG